jgi:RimJ/RimL family protein N-acetyltransferase
MRIRPATPADAAAIAAVHVASWQGAYRGQLPDEVLDGLDVERRTAGWQQYLAQDGQATFVAEDEGRVVGFVHLNAARDDDAEPATGEVIAIYALPEAWGTGAGRELMAAALEWLREAGYRTATLWVLDRNARARRFYELAGWEPDGVAKDDVVAGVPVTEVRYRRAL